MSNFLEPVFPKDEVVSQRRPRRRLVIIAIVAVVALVGIFMLMHLGPFAKDTKESNASTQDTPSVHTESSCPVGQLAVPGYGTDSTVIKCVSQEEYDRQQDEQWATHRQSVIDANARLQAGLDDLQAQFDAATTLSGKLGRVLTTYCHSSLKNERFELVPDEKRPSSIAISTSTPSTYGSTNSMRVPNDPSDYYDPFVLYGDFDKRAEQLWNTTWDSEAVNFALPASFERAIAQVGCDHR